MTNHAHNAPWRRRAALVGVAVAFGLTLLILDAALGPAYAQWGGTGGTGSSAAVFQDMNSKATDLFYNIRTLILLICSIAVIGTMGSALSGRFPMQKAVVLAFAIVVIAVASSIVTYFASPSTTTQSGSVPHLIDTGSVG